MTLPGIASAYRPNLALAPGDYRVQVRREGYAGADETVRIAAGQRTTRTIVLARSGPASVGEEYRDKLGDGVAGPIMVVLPTGSFQRGSDSGESGRDNNEGPVRTATINYPIAMGKHEVTFEEYDRFAQETDRKRPEDRDWGRGSRPVINVSWEDANAYAQWLSEQTGKVYRLPSEAEWEYAARAGTSTRYSWGNETGRNRGQLRWLRQPLGQ